MGTRDEIIQDLVLTVSKVSEEIQKLTTELRELNLSKYEDYVYDGKTFNYLQYQEITKGIEQGLDISLYADPDYDELKMATIRSALNDGVLLSKDDFSAFYDFSQLFQVIRYRRIFPNGIDHFSPDMPADKISIFITAKEIGVDITPYINEFDAKQLKVILDCLINNYDVNKLAISGMSLEQMQVIYKGLDRNLDVTKYNDVNLSVDDMQTMYEYLLREDMNSELSVEYYCLTSDSSSVSDHKFSDINNALRYRDDNGGTMGVIVNFIHSNSDIIYSVDYQLLNRYKEVNFESLDDLFDGIPKLKNNYNFLTDLNYLMQHSNSSINPDVEEKYFSSISDNSRNDIGGKRL